MVNYYENGFKSEGYQIFFKLARLELAGFYCIKEAMHNFSIESKNQICCTTVSFNKITVSTIRSKQIKQYEFYFSQFSFCKKSISFFYNVALVRYCL